MKRRQGWMFAALASSALLLQLGCMTTTRQGHTKILDADADDGLGGTGTESGDIRSVAQRMSREIVGIQWPAKGSIPRIAVIPLNNQTRFRIDPKLLQNKLLKELVKNAHGRVMFLARDSEQAVIAEREKKRAGMYDSGRQDAAMAGADYLLKGEMRGLAKASREGNSDYIVYTFQLIDAESGGILWMGDYETKKAADVDAVYQ